MIFYIFEEKHNNTMMIRFFSELPSQEKYNFTNINDLLIEAKKI